MTTRTTFVRMFAGVAVAIVATAALGANNPYQQPVALESYLKGNAEIGKAEAAIVAAKAQVMVSAAQARSAVAKAIDDNQKVVSMSLDNDLKAAKAFFEKKKMYAEYQASRRDAYVPKADAPAETSAPRPMAGHIDARGRVLWPPVFQRDEFASARAEIDALFTRRHSGAAGLGSRFCRQVKSHAGQMREELKEAVDELTPGEYLAARRFLDQLSVEAQLPPRIEGVAAR